MASPKTTRKLTAILCADVVGCSRLMGENEAVILWALIEYREVFSDYIEKFQGRVCASATRGQAKISPTLGLDHFVPQPDMFVSPN